MFSGKTVFDTFIALSPTLWWNDGYILSEEREFISSSAEMSHNEQSVRSGVIKAYLSYGHYEQHIHRRKTWSDEEYSLRAAHALKLRTNDSIEEMATRLCNSHSFELVKCKEYRHEDHGSVAGCALGWSIGDVLDPDRFA